MSNDFFDRGAIQTEAGNVQTSGSGADNSGEQTAGAALGTSNEQAQTTEQPTEQKPETSGGNQITDSQTVVTEEAPADKVVEPDQLVEKPEESLIKFGEDGFPAQDANLVQVRTWGEGLKRDLDAIKPVAEKVTEFGGLRKVESAVKIYDALASPNYTPEVVLDSLQNMSEERYSALIMEAFNRHQDVFLQTLKLNPTQFKIAARAVLEGRQITEDDVAAAEIPFGISPEAWNNLDESEQQKLTESAKAAAEANRIAEDAKRSETSQKIERAQEGWVQSLDAEVNKVCDSFKIEDAGLKERIRRNVWAALSGVDKVKIGEVEIPVAEKFFASINHFQKGEIEFAQAMQPMLETVVTHLATEEAEFYDKSRKLQSQIDQMKLSRAGDRKEIKTGDTSENLSVNRGNNSNDGNIDVNDLFGKEAIRGEAALIRR